MKYEEFLKEREKDPSISLIGRKTWTVYKSKFGGAENAINKLKTKYNFGLNKVGVYKVSKENILQIQAEIKLGIDKELIAKKYGITSRSVYRYRDLEIK